MALELGALHDALVKAGASHDVARAAAEEVAAYLTPPTVNLPISLLLVMMGMAIGLTLAMLTR